MRFYFKAKTKIGEIKEGFVDAASEDAAAVFLQKNELFPLNIVEDGANPTFGRSFSKYFDRASEKDLVIFFRQLAILIEAKVPIVTSLVAISEQTSNVYFRGVITDVKKDIEDGMTFSDALARHGDVFSSLSINIIKSGEVSGNLRKSIEYVANNIEKNYNLTSKIKSALTYPAIVVVVFFIISFLVVTIIIPKLSIMIKDMNVAVPWYTSALINFGDFSSKYWWVFVVMFFAVIIGVVYYLKTDNGKREWDQIKLKIPVIGKMFTYVYIVRFSENLAVLLSGGIPIVKALTTVSQVVGNSVYEEVILQVAEDVKVGKTMHETLERSAVFPPMVTHMVKIGEDSGQIDAVLGHIASFYDQEFELMARNMSTLIEPVMMILIGLGVGFLAVAVLMPIYNIAGQI